MDHRVLPLWCALHCRLFMAKLSFVVQPLFHGSLFGSSLFFLCDLFLVMQLVHPSIFLIDPNVLLLASGTHGALFGSCHLLLAFAIVAAALLCSAFLLVLFGLPFASNDDCCRRPKENSFGHIISTLRVQYARFKPLPTLFIGMKMSFCDVFMSFI